MLSLLGLSRQQPFAQGGRVALASGVFARDADLSRLRVFVRPRTPYVVRLDVLRVER